MKENETGDSSPRQTTHAWEVREDAEFSGSKDFPWIVVSTAPHGPCDPNVVASRISEENARLIVELHDARLASPRQTLDERAEFEKWARVSGLNFYFAYEQGRGYIDADTWKAFQAWQARAELRVLSPAKEKG
jgi:hypothetical protein